MEVGGSPTVMPTTMLPQTQVGKHGSVQSMCCQTYLPQNPSTVRLSISSGTRSQISLSKSEKGKKRKDKGFRGCERIKSVACSIVPATA